MTPKNNNDFVDNPPSTNKGWDEEMHNKKNVKKLTLEERLKRIAARLHPVEYGVTDALRGVDEQQKKKR